MNIYFRQLVDHLLTQSWQITVLTMVVALLVFLLRNKSAHVRYLLWLIVLAKCLVPPLYGVPLRVLPEDSLGARLLGVQSPEVPRAEKNARNSDLPLQPLNTAKPQQSSFVIPEPAIAGETHISRVQRLTWAEACYWLGLLWLVGMCVYLAFNVLRALRTNHWLRRARRPLPRQSLAEIAKFFSARGSKSLPAIWLAEDVSQPFVWGLVRGSIYLPADFLHANNLAQQHNTLGHEISHVVRFDAAVNFLQVLSQAIFWFHPVVWWANIKIRREREKCCDEMAVARLAAQPKEYSMAVLETLVTPQESVRPVPSLAIAGPARNLEERIRVIMRPGRRFYLRPSLTAVTVVLALAVLIVPGALVLTARAEETKTTSQSEEKSIQSIHEAVVYGNVEQIKRLIARGVSVNAQDHSGWTPLHHVTKWRPHIEVHNLYRHDPKAMAEIRKQAGILEMAKLLVSNGAEVNIKDNKGNTPLHYAVEGEHKNIVELLISKGADVNARNQEGQTPIEFFNGYEYNVNEIGVERVLLEHGAQVPTIHLAAMVGDLEKVKSFVDQGVPTDARTTALKRAADFCHIDIVEYLINNGTDVNADILERAGCGELAQIFIDRGANVNGDDNSGRPLFMAAAGGRIDTMRVLLANGADTEVRNSMGMTPLLFTAMTYKCKESTLFLIANGADVNAKDNWDRTPLQTVAALGWLDAAEALIEKGADIDAADKAGWTPLHRAASNGYKEVVELLIDKGADPRAKIKAESTPSDLALAGNHKEVVRVFATEDATDIPEIYLAAYLGDMKKLGDLVNQTKDVEHRDKHGKTLLSYAALGGNTGIVRFLINENARLDSTDEKRLTPLHYAAFGNRAANVDLLLAKGADINADSEEGTPLHMAIRSEGIVLSGYPGMSDGDKTDMAELLIARGADLNVCNETIGTPLHYAVGRVQKNIVKLLIVKGADVNAKGGEQVEGGTPLHAAALHPYGDDVAEFLILGSADVDAKDNDGATLLHLCAQRGWRTPHAELLLAHGADVDARDKHNATPLHCAVRSEHNFIKDMARLLVAHGADVNAKTDEGETPLSLAQEKGHTEIVDLLRKHGAKQ